MVSLFIILVACSVPASASFTDDQLDAALTELAASRTQMAALPEASLQVTLANREQKSMETLGKLHVSLSDPHEDGIYLVGVEISVGLWRSLSSEQNFCYWARRKYDGLLLGSYYGLPGIDMRIDEKDYEVELDGCGTWIFLGTD